MQTLKKRKSIKYITISIALLLCITIALISGTQSYNSAVDTPTTPTADTKLNANYTAFEDGSTYEYTDIDKVETAHNDPSESDTSSVFVDREQSHGSLQNPFVINTVTQWNYFATNSSSGATDSNNVFVLGQDIDFSGQTSNVVDSFAGKFYGGGHTLLNFSNTSGTANNFGVFCQISNGAIIADINLDNVTISSTAGRVGALVGRTNGGDILNCHIKGSVTGTAKVPGSNSTLEYDGVGGLVGDVKGDNVKVYIYRCSLDIKLTMTSQTGGASGGGLIGSVSCLS